MANQLGYRIQLDTVRSGYDRKTCWVHARPGAIPGDKPIVIIMMQKLRLTGSDVFYSLNEMRTDDMGKTWTGPTSHDQTLGRKQWDNGIEAVACDFNPKWHAKTGKLLGTGHVACYQNDTLMAAPRPRQACYSVYDQTNRTWSNWDTLAMPDEKKFFNSGAGSSQRYDLENGDILLPIYFRNAEGYLTTTVVRCAFDGVKLTYIEHDSELTIPEERGMGEPSLTRFKGRYYLTIRNDLRGYVTAGEDGLHFETPQPWCFDDGQDLGNYNTQQHWVTHSDGLFLVYTRRNANNDHVMRHRAPLFIAQVDPDQMRVIRKTERILVPERGARLGNFNVTNVNEHETWVTVSEWMQTTLPNPFDCTVCERYGSDNSVFAARIIWDKPNQLMGKR